MKDYGQKILLIFSFSLYSAALLANLSSNFPDEGLVDKANNAFIDPTVNYQEFMGRVSDKDKSGRILKIKVENNNTKFFKAGDSLSFRVNKHKTKFPCSGSVKNTEDFFFIIYVSDLDSCWPNGKYFPRGMQLNFESKDLANRVFEASKFREVLLLRKDGFLNQLNNINNFIWTYNQQKIKTASTFDDKINELKKQRQRAIDGLLQKKQESLLLQVELQKKLNGLDESLQHYRVERQEYLLDRWNLDHDLGGPFPQRPMPLKRR